MEAPCHRGQHAYGGMRGSQTKRVEELEEEGVQLKNLGADLSLDKAMLEELAKGSS